MPPKAKKRRRAEDRDAEDEGRKAERGRTDVEEDFFAVHLSEAVDRARVEAIGAERRAGRPQQTSVPGFGTHATVLGRPASRPNFARPYGLADVAEMSSALKKHLQQLMRDREVPADEEEEDEEWSDEERAIFSTIFRYVDLLMVPSRSARYQLLYMAHALNHVIRTRNLVIANKKLFDETNATGNPDEALLESLRDEGFARPTVLILTSTRKVAYKLVSHLKQLLFGLEEPRGSASVQNAARFETEFGDNGYEVAGPRKGEDYKELMSGNVDDFFRVGVALSKKSLRLFVPFAKADIILCSPVALRMIVADNNEEKHLVSSIQLLIVDKADELLMQNWEHVLLVLDSLNKPPTAFSTDISRVRTAYLEGGAAGLMQMLFFSTYRHELFDALVTNFARNWEGLVLYRPIPEGIMDRVEIPLCQELHRVECSDPGSQSDARFAHFKDKVLPKLEANTLIFIPSYYDFVRIRNHMKRTDESFCQVHEYAEEGKVAKARSLFFHSKKRLLLLTERHHYFKRFHIRGAKSLLFYQAPSNPIFYADIVNGANEPEGGGRVRAILLYTKFDGIRLANVFGAEMARGILASEKQIQALVSE